MAFRFRNASMATIAADKTRSCNASGKERNASVGAYYKGLLVQMEEQHQAKLKETELELQRAQDLNTTTCSELMAIKSEKEALETANAALATEVSRLHQQLAAERDARLAEGSAQMRLKTLYASVSAEAESLRGQLADVSREQQQQQQQQEATTVELAVLHRQVADLTAEVGTLRRLAEEAERAAEPLRRQAAEAEQLRRQLGTSRRQVTVLEARLAAAVKDAADGVSSYKTCKYDMDILTGKYNKLIAEKVVLQDLFDPLLEAVAADEDRWIAADEDVDSDAAATRPTLELEAVRAAVVVAYHQLAQLEQVERAKQERRRRAKQLAKDMSWVA